MSERIRVDIRNHVADVKLVRSDKMNALDDAMFEALIETSAALEARKDVRAVVLSGEGRAFCAGLDMGNFAKMAVAGEPKEQDTSVAGGRLTPRTHGMTNRAQQAVWGWRTLRVPVIAAVHGVAFGGGFQVMLGPDIRIIHPETKLSILEVKWGLIPDMGGTPIMRRLAREDMVRELTYTGRVFTGAEAKEYGFATHVSDTPYEDALIMAADIASKSPTAVQTAKAIYNRLGDASDAEALLTESVEQDRIMGSANQIEAVKAGLQKREGQFQD